MASVIYLDTHVVAWLFSHGAALLSPDARREIEAADRILISPMVRLELQYLYDVERLASPPRPVLDGLATAIGLGECDASFPAIARRAESLSWTRDPFDRLIVAHADLAKAPLITKDEIIRGRYARAVW